jgi:hypothetical protein
MGVRPRQRLGAPLKHQAAAGIVRDMITAGTLKPGSPVPSAAELARKTGYSQGTCLIGLRSLVAAGTITRGVSSTAKLADKLSVSTTTVGHAETGRLWQARGFWIRADLELGCDGELLRKFDRYKAAECTVREETAGGAPEETASPVPVMPVSVAITADGVRVTWPDGTETLVTPPGCQAWPEARMPGD